MKRKVTSRIIPGDVICFTEKAFDYGKPCISLLGERVVTAIVLGHEHGATREEDRFDLRVLGSTGVNALPFSRKIRRTGRKLYANGVDRRLWTDETVREEALAVHETRKRARRVQTLKEGQHEQKQRTQRAQATHGGGLQAQA